MTRRIGICPWRIISRAGRPKLKGSLEEHFKEEERQGRMSPVSEKEAQKEYPG